MIKIGMIIGDRYEILEKIGTGGMSDVYKAKCHKLNRLVAVKVLKQEFSENANFVSKFKIEAQAAAGLMHPNIVNVYDVGEENGIYYIVMELVEGLTLKKYIEKKAHLSVKESVTIAIQICMGIECAHNNHIIHRDIKPQNVIISKEGKVKVTDFGIAKAASSNTITGNVMGSVHYTSPEQARGGFSDEKSDIYSLGITLFEMLTGRVPFNGDTTVAIAIKQIQEPMPSMLEFVPEIPLCVEQIVQKCTQKSPDRRYPNMSELVDDLKQSLANPEADFVKIVSEDEFAKTRPMSATEMQELKKTVKTDTSTEITGNLQVADPEGEENEEYNSKMDRITAILAIVVGVIICIVVILLIKKALETYKFGQTGVSDTTSLSAEMVVMPKVEGHNAEKAVSILKEAGLQSKIIYAENDEYAEGIVVSASQREGLKVAAGTEIELTVSAGAVTEEVPSVVGLSSTEANRRIMDKGFLVSIKTDYSETVEKGKVISQEPEGNTKAPAKSEIVIVVSDGSKEQPVEIPNFVGKPIDEAERIVKNLGLQMQLPTYVSNSEYAAHQIIEQSIEAGEKVEKGTKIAFTVSNGPAATDKYYFEADILAPTINEDPDFVSGTYVRVVVKASTGRIYYDSVSERFPISVTINNIYDSGKGIIEMTYEVTKSPESVTDPVTGETKLVPGKTEEHTIEREIEFTRFE